jgi:hypothetical protein
MHNLSLSPTFSIALHNPTQSHLIHFFTCRTKQTAQSEERNFVTQISFHPSWIQDVKRIYCQAKKIFDFFICHNRRLGISSNHANGTIPKASNKNKQHKHHDRFSISPEYLRVILHHLLCFDLLTLQQVKS